MAIDVVSQIMDISDQFVAFADEACQEQMQNSPRISGTASSAFTRLTHWSLPVSPFSEYSAQAPSTLGSPFMSSPMMGHQQNFGSSKNLIPCLSAMTNSVLLSPSSPYAASPASTSYSSSSTESPQHPNPHPPEEFLRYGLRQSVHRHAFASQGYPPCGSYAVYPGRRRRRDELLSREEYEKRRLRRERNKQAAWRCRTRRRERIEALEQETAEIEGQNSLVESEISNLKDELAELKKNLQEHECCRRQTSDIAPPKVIGVKVKQESS